MSGSNLTPPDSGTKLTYDDPDLDAIKVFRLVEGRYQRVAELLAEVFED